MTSRLLGGIVVITAKISDDSTAVHLDKKYESLKEAANDLGSVPLIPLC